MGQDRFDDVARTLARPMSRRGVLRTLGAAAAATMVPALRPARARAAECDLDTQLDCWHPMKSEGWCCPLGGYDCGAPYTELCLPDPCPSGETRCGITCCQPGDECVDGPSGKIRDKTCEARCTGTRCGDRCCDEDEQCVDGRCVRRCPPGRARCGDRCCPKGRRCQGGRCVKCAKGRRACGNRCCPKGQDCCTDDTGNAVCCDTRRRSCCEVGPAGGRRMTCCPSKTRCAPQLDLTEGGVTAGVPRDATQLCCPPKRYVPSAGCCPPGYRSLGGKLVVPAGGGGGQCCREDKICGSGRNVTCCGTGTATAPELEQWCVDGTCQGRPG